MKNRLFAIGVIMFYALVVLFAVESSGCASTGGGLVGDACYYAQQVCASANAICEVVNRRGTMSELDEEVKRMEKSIDSLALALSTRDVSTFPEAKDFHLERLRAYADSLTQSAYGARSP